MKSGHMPWKVIDSDGASTTIRTGFFLPVRNSDRGSNPWRILEIVVGGVTVSSPDNETKNGNKENKQGCNRTNNHPGRKLAEEENSEKKKKEERMLTWKRAVAGVWIQDHSHVQANTHTALRCVHPDIIIDYNLYASQIG